LIKKAQCKKHKQKNLFAHHSARCGNRKFNEVRSKTVRRGNQIADPDNSDKKKKASYSSVNKKFQRSIHSVFAAPDAG
jgi:hypothetical protein